MRRGDLYRVKRPNTPDKDPRAYRSYVVISRQVLIDSRHSTVVCAPIYSRHNGLSTQVGIGIAEGLKHPSSIHCDNLVSLPKSVLRHYLGKLDESTLRQLDKALAIAIGIA